MTSSYGHDEEMLSALFWRSMAAGEFCVQRCRSCGRCRFPPNRLCPECHSLAYDWLPIDGSALVYSYTVVHRAPTEDWADRVPYSLIVGRLVEGPLVLGYLRNPSAAPVDVDAEVRLRIERRATGRATYFFEFAE